MIDRLEAHTEVDLLLDLARQRRAFDVLAWVIWPADGLDELLGAGAFRIPSVQSESLAESIDRGRAAWTVPVKLTDIDQLRRLAVRANPAQAQLIAESLAVAWQNAADPFAPLHSIPGSAGNRRSHLRAASGADTKGR